jgi:hypothetical protein
MQGRDWIWGSVWFVTKGWIKRVRIWGWEVRRKAAERVEPLVGCEMGDSRGSLGSNWQRGNFSHLCWDAEPLRFGKMDTIGRCIKGCSSLSLERNVSL